MAPRRAHRVTAMTPQRWQRLEELYDAVAELPPTERARFLDEQCQGDEELRRELTAMLRDAASGFTNAVENTAAVVAEAPDSWTGTRVGPYRIVRQIGQGGMGAVYEGVREDAFRMRVAIKLVKYSFDSEFARHRFQRERQILARLDHPNIAHLLDGGDSEGLPYLAMEFVEGEPLLAAASTLDLRRKLRLFQQILSAVSYAHRNLIVHRDLKPSNILVTAEGDPKLLDFGIARLIEEDSGGAGAHTMTVAAMMTPDYASPEQVKGEPAGVPSDIYSLGAILFELLGGARPHRLESYSTAEVYRAICESELRAPSAAAADPRIRRELRGDLDTLVLHAMAKDAASRYSSAEAFSAEIERYLEGRPLTVRPASALERAWKFVKRNRLAVGAGVAAAASLIAGATVSTIEARRAERRFAQVRELANTFLFQFYDQVTPLPGSTAVRASIVETARKYLDGLAKEAGNDRGLLFELAQAYQRLGEVEGSQGEASLGQVEDARRSFQRSQDLYERLPVNRASPPEWRRAAAQMLVIWAQMEFVQGHSGVAEALARRAMPLVEGGPQDDQTRLVQVFVERRLAAIRLSAGAPSEAVALLESAGKTLLDLEASGRGPRDLPARHAKTRDELARARVAMGDLDGVLSSFQELIRSSEPCDESAPPGQPCRDLATRLSWAADVYGALDRPNLGQPEKAAPLYRQSIHIQERLAAQDPQDRQARFDLAARYGRLGDVVWRDDPRQALELYERALTTAKALVSKEQAALLRESYLNAIARPLIRLGRTVEDRRALAELLKPGGVVAAPQSYDDRLDSLAVRTLWARLLAAEGKREEAERTLDELTRSGEALRTSHPNDLTAVFILSNCYRELAAIATGEQRRNALLRSAVLWHSWPATSYTRSEEQRDLAAAGR